ncbi:ROK family protein [Methylobacterium planeticum]|uniref:ROK family protein n=1 Tax=Methylobacterium planeticum TaxID=2615211 RepID=A0A6N6MIG6_9HYPH|nr:ROK family protein [Methylobacterium planeticum]KAB1069336.1 ROK family protein [Methylobacterium planeticum]
MSIRHGTRHFPDNRLDAYNLKLEQNGGFVGDRVRSKAFTLILDGLREEARRSGPDPLGDTASEDRPSLDDLLERPGSEAGAVVARAVDLYAAAFADVVRRFLAEDEWRGTERVVVGGGLRESRLGKEAIRRAGALLRAGGHTVEVLPIRADPDEAALLGALHLLPLGERDRAFLAVDIGGGNIRAGVVVPPEVGDLEGRVLFREHWRHRKEPVGRDDMVGRMVGMLSALVERAEADGLALAPFVGIGCPGEIQADGAIASGTQNLPGHWQEPDFNLPTRVAKSLGRIGGEPVSVLLHNDAVLQGLSELTRMRDVSRWGVLTIGTGLGNARFTSTEAWASV